MTKRKTNRAWLVGMGALPIIFAAVAIAEEKPGADRGARKVTRVGSEIAVGGITLEERNKQQADLYSVVSAETPARAYDTKITIGITQRDQADIDAPWVSGTPLRIGVVKAITGLSANAMPPDGQVARQGAKGTIGVREDTADGGFVWAITVTSPGAQAIRVHFTDFALPKNAEMYFYSAVGQVDGPYVGLGRNGTGDFWSKSIPTDTGVIQLRFNGVPTAADLRSISFVVSELAHIQGRPAPQPAGGDGSIATHDTWPCSDNSACLVDVNCVNTGPAGPAEDAVAKMEWIQGPFVNTCTGGLLADTDGSSQIPYFLTANHCTSSSISNLETWFNYTTDSCNGACPHNILTGGAPPSDTVGFTVVASNSTSDFTLGTLDQAPPAGAVFLGWNNTPIAFTNATQLYRISNANFGPQVYSQQQVDTSSPVCSGLARGNIIYSDTNTGGTMGGSSGSPVVNSAGEVVGQLFGCCGFDCADDCATAPTNWTVDGAFAVTWPFVEEFLAPQGGCTSDAECDDGLFCTGTETCVSGSCQSSGDPCPGGTTCNEATDTCDAAACDNDGSCEAGEDCNNCPNDCRSKTNGNPNSRYCCDGDLPDCGDSRCSESGFSCGGGGGCTTDPDCDDGDPCNGAEACVGGSCQGGTAPPCQNGDGCCPSGCTSANDDDCVECTLGQVGDPCVDDVDCCSNKCRGRSGAKTCK